MILAITISQQHRLALLCALLVVALIIWKILNDNDPKGPNRYA